MVMANWQRFGDGTWVNVDQVEVVRIDEQAEGGWQLTAAFASGRTHPLGSHADRDLLVDCTDVLLRGEVGEHLRALADPAGESVSDPTLEPELVPAFHRRWRFWRSGPRPSSGLLDGHPPVGPLPAR